MVLVIHGGRVMGFWWGHGVPSRRVVVWGGGEILIKTYPGTNLCPPPLSYSCSIQPPTAPFSLFLALCLSPSLRLPPLPPSLSLALLVYPPLPTPSFLPHSLARLDRA